MKKLLLLRHAKSDWHTGAETDLDRPLNKRGRKSAPIMGQRLAERGCAPDLIISSPAQRARETAEIIASQLRQAEVDIAYNPLIYGADLETLIQLVYELDDELENIILVGHNPGLSELGQWLSDDAPEWIPTCGMLALEMAIDCWRNASKGCAYLAGYNYPKKTGPE